MWSFLQNPRPGDTRLCSIWCTSSSMAETHCLNVKSKRSTRCYKKAELSSEADSENDLGGSSEIMYFIGLDVHKKTISYCVKDAAGRVHQEGKIGSTRRELDGWIRTMPQPRMIAMEATIFTGWIYDHLLPHAETVKVAHPLMLRAIAAAKKKNDKIDAGKIADCLRCDFLPECHMASTAIRDRRRTLRYRNLLIKQMVQMKNRVSGLLMETGVSYNKQRLHKVGYFAELMSTNEEVNEDGVDFVGHPAHRVRALCHPRPNPRTRSFSFLHGSRMTRSGSSRPACWDRKRECCSNVGHL